MAQLEFVGGKLIIHGKLRSMVCRELSTAETVISKKPKPSSVEASQSQKEHRERFKQAVAYARAAMAEAAVCAVYKIRAAEAGKRPRDLAISDYLNGIDLLAKR